MYKWDMHTVMWKPLRLAFQYERGAQDGWISLLFYFQVILLLGYFDSRGQYWFRGQYKPGPYSRTVVREVLSSLFWLKYSAGVLSFAITFTVQLLASISFWLATNERCTINPPPGGLEIVCVNFTVNIDDVLFGDSISLRGNRTRKIPTRRRPCY